MPRRTTRLLLAAAAAMAMTSTSHAFNISSLDQCANITVSWGSGGQAPYEVLLVPTGHIKPIETRTIINYQNITSATNSISFPLTFPAGSSFVAVLSDSRYGVGSGGTSEVLTVRESNDSSCLDTKQTRPQFYFYLDPPAPAQCSDWEISWPTSVSSSSPASSEGISLWAVVPGQTTFSVPLPSPVEIDSLDCGTWNVDLAEGTNVMLVAGYEPGSINAATKKRIVNGRGAGGSTDVFSVGSGNSSSCLSSDPVETATLFASSTSATSSSTSTGTATSTTSGTSPIGAAGQGGGALASLNVLPTSVIATLAMACVGALLV